MKLERCKHPPLFQDLRQTVMSKDKNWPCLSLAGSMADSVGDDELLLPAHDTVLAQTKLVLFAGDE